MSGYLILAAQLDALADWLDGELAAGAPAKHLLHVAITAVRHVAGVARLEGPWDGKDDAAALDALQAALDWVRGLR